MSNNIVKSLAGWLFICFFIFCSCSKETIVTTGGVGGTVSDLTRQEPLSGVLLTLHPGGKSLHTGSDGRYEFLNLEAKQYTITTEKDQYKSESKTVTIVPGENTRVDFLIRSGEGTMQLTKTYLDYGQNEHTLVFDIKNVGKKDFSFSIANNNSWMKVTPASGVVKAGETSPVAVEIDRTKITENKTATLSVKSDAGSGEVTVSVELYTKTGVISLNKSELDFGETNNMLSFDVINNGNADFQFNIAHSNTWLLVSPASGSVAKKSLQTVTVNVDRSKVAESKNISLIVSSDVGSKEVVVKVTKPILQGVLELSTSILDFSTNQTSMNFSVRNVGTADMLWTSLVRDGDWLNVSPVSGTINPNNANNVTVNVDRAKLMAGANQATVEIAANGITKSITVNAIGLELPQHVVSNGLNAYFRFNDNTQNAVAGGVGGVAMNSPQYVSGADATKAISLSGALNSYVSFPQPLIDQKNVSVSFWLKNPNDGHIFSVTTKNTSYPKSFIMEMKNGMLRYIPRHYDFYFMYNDANSMPFFTHVNLNDNKWHMITMTADHGVSAYGKVTMKLYVDGLYSDSYSVYYNPFDTGDQGDLNHGNKFVVGGSVMSNKTTVSGSTMIMDNLRIYSSRVISSDEVKKIFEVEKQ